MFPHTAVGYVQVSSDWVATPDVLIRQIEKRIRSYKPSGITADAASILFHAGLLRLVSAKNLLAPISRGLVEVSAQDTGLIVSYKLWFSEVIIAGTLMSMTFAVWSQTHSISPLVVFLVFWVWFVDGSYTVGVVLFRSMLKKASLGLRPS